MPAIRTGAAALCIAAFVAPSAADAQQAGIGRFRTVQGPVTVVRAGTDIAAVPAMAVHVADEIVTGPAGLAGIGFDDESVLSVGPSSRLSIDRYVHAAPARFESSLVRGTLAVAAGKIARSSAEAMKVRTPNAVLGVRGTVFVVEVAGKP